MGVTARWRQTTVGEYSSEFLGTFVLIMFGDGVVAMVVAALNQSGGVVAHAAPRGAGTAFTFPNHYAYVG